MNTYIECFVMIPFVVVMYQCYMWVLSLHGYERQRQCKALGIAYTTLGIVCFVVRSISFTIIGLILIMCGLRLIAYGLDRLNKSNFIDQFDDDQLT